MLSIGHQLRGLANFNPGFRRAQRDLNGFQVSEIDRRITEICLSTFSISRNVPLPPRDKCYTLFYGFTPAFPFPREVSGNFQRISRLSGHSFRRSPIPSYGQPPRSLADWILNRDYPLSSRFGLKLAFRRFHRETFPTFSHSARRIFESRISPRKFLRSFRNVYFSHHSRRHAARSQRPAKREPPPIQNYQKALLRQFTSPHIPPKKLLATSEHSHDLSDRRTSLIRFQSWPAFFRDARLQSRSGPATFARFPPVPDVLADYLAFRRHATAGCIKFSVISPEEHDGRCVKILTHCRRRQRDDAGHWNSKVHLPTTPKLPDAK